ncbi:MAG: exonuclease domain-containing protein [Candidatus Omnitrophota bacterium]
MQKLIDKELVIFDLETTGLDPQGGDRICEIAAIKYKDFQPTASFHLLIDPERPISTAAFLVNHISADMLKGAPKNSLILPKFLEFINGSYVASYNIRFDLNFLQNELKMLGKEVSGNQLFFDILTLARRTMPHLTSYSLANVSYVFEIAKKQEHRALADVEMTWQVLAGLLSLLKKKGIKSFSELYTLCGFNVNLINQANEQKVAFILRAIDFHFDISIRYFSKGPAEVTERKVTPKEIYEENGKKYLVGYCHLRNDERNFAVDTILHLDVEE